MDIIFSNKCEGVAIITVTDEVIESQGLQIIKFLTGIQHTITNVRFLRQDHNIDTAKDREDLTGPLVHICLNVGQGIVTVCVVAICVAS